MANLIEWIVARAGSEQIEGVVIGELGWGDYGCEDVPTWDKQIRNTVLTWEEAVPMLDYEFDPGFGSPKCNAVTVWTKSWVIFIAQYDGATSPYRIPRNPTNHVPEMPGG